MATALGTALGGYAALGNSTAATASAAAYLPGNTAAAGNPYGFANNNYYWPTFAGSDYVANLTSAPFAQNQGYYGWPGLNQQTAYGGFPGYYQQGFGAVGNPDAVDQGSVAPTSNVVSKQQATVKAGAKSKVVKKKVKKQETEEEEEEEEEEYDEDEDTGGGEEEEDEEPVEDQEEEERSETAEEEGDYNEISEEDKSVGKPKRRPLREDSSGSRETRRKKIREKSRRRRGDTRGRVRDASRRRDRYSDEEYHERDSSRSYERDWRRDYSDEYNEVDYGDEYGGDSRYHSGERAYRRGESKYHSGERSRPTGYSRERDSYEYSDEDHHQRSYEEDYEDDYGGRHYGHGSSRKEVVHIDYYEPSSPPEEPPVVVHHHVHEYPSTQAPPVVEYPKRDEPLECFCSLGSVGYMHKGKKKKKKDPNKLAALVGLPVIGGVFAALAGISALTIGTVIGTLNLTSLFSGRSGDSFDQDMFFDTTNLDFDTGIDKRILDVSAADENNKNTQKSVYPGSFVVPKETFSEEGGGEDFIANGSAAQPYPPAAETIDYNSPSFKFRKGALNEGSTAVAPHRRYKRRVPFVDLANELEFIDENEIVLRMLDDLMMTYKYGYIPKCSHYHICKLNKAAAFGGAPQSTVIPLVSLPAAWILGKPTSRVMDYLHAVWLGRNERDCDEAFPECSDVHVSQSDAFSKDAKSSTGSPTASSTIFGFFNSTTAKPKVKMEDVETEAETNVDKILEDLRFLEQNATAADAASSSMAKPSHTAATPTGGADTQSA